MLMVRMAEVVELSSLRGSLAVGGSLVAGEVGGV